MYCVIFVILINTLVYKTRKANMIYGKEYCTKNEKKSSLTNRCQQCGKLKKENYDWRKKCQYINQN